MTNTLPGVSTDEAFEVLAHELRLEIIRELWEAGVTRPHDGDPHTTGVTFTDLRRRVGVADSGRFNYHLRKLTPHFVERAPDGYRLNAAGVEVARTIHPRAADR